MKPLLRILLILCVAAAILSSPATPAAGQSKSGLDVVLLIDNSTSLGTGTPGGGGNDPNNLRWSAAQLFVDLASPGDRIGAFTFSTNVRPIGEAANGLLIPITDQSSKDKMKALLAARQTEGWTDMRAGLRSALDLLKKNKGVNRQVIVFLTDGRPEPTDQIPALNANIEEAGRSGVIVFPILLGSNVDQDVANKMVRDTGGLLQEVPAPAQLPRAFGKIYTFIDNMQYADELAITNSRMAFRTNLNQSITRVSIIVPRENENSQAIRAVSLENQAILGLNSLPDGARVTFTEAPHYQLITVTHNAPLKGDWVVESPPAISGSGLLLATSTVTLDLLHPLPQVAGSFVSPRLVPAGKSSLLVGRVLQTGNELGDVPLTVNTGSGQSITFHVDGVSNNHSLEWASVDFGLKGGAERRIEIQLGAETTPFRLRKEFVIQSGENVPRLVIDSPTPQNSGLVAGGKLKIAAHFDRPANSTQAIVYVSDIQSGEVREIRLNCSGVTCQDTSFTPQPGHSYQFILVGTGQVNNNPFSDGGRTFLAMKDSIILSGLESLSKGITFSPGSNPPPIDILVSAFLQQGQPALIVQFADLNPAPAGVDPKGLVATLMPLEMQNANTFKGRLSFTGFDRLPVGEYTASLVFTSPRLQDVIIEPARLPIQFKISRPVARLLNLPNPLDFEMINNLTEKKTKTLEVDFGSTQPFDIQAQIIEVATNYGSDSPANFQLDLGRPTAVAQPGTQSLNLSLSALAKPRPGNYRLKVRFLPVNPSIPSQIEPEEALLTFSIPEPSLGLVQITAPDMATNCPPVDGPVDPRVLDFGAILDIGKPSRVDLVMEGRWIEGTPQLQAQLTLNGVRPLSSQSSAAQVTTGTLLKIKEGQYELPLNLRLAEGISAGIYEGKVSLSGQYLRLEPSELPIRFEARNDLGGRLVQFVQPAVCTARDWLSVATTPDPFPRWKGILSWVVLVIIGLIIGGGCFNKPYGIVRETNGDKKIRFNLSKPALVLHSGEEFQLCQDRKERSRAIVEVSLSMPVDTDKEDDEEGIREIQAYLQPGPVAPEYTIRYQKRNRLGLPVFVSVPVEGIRLERDMNIDIKRKADNLKPVEYEVEIIDPKNP